MKKDWKNVNNSQEKKYTTSWKRDYDIIL